MSFAERLKSARKDAGMTQEELGNKIGVSKSTITGYEKGYREPDFFKIKEMSKVLGIDANYLLGTDLPISKKDILWERYQEAPDGIRESVDKLLDMPE